MKIVVLLLVLAGAFWWMFGRRKPPAKPPAKPAPASRDASASPTSSGQDSAGASPQVMVACAHCGVHLPKGEAVLDAEERVFCSNAHRLAGPPKA